MNINEKMDKGMDFTGTWHIYEMEAWDEDYFSMDVQAYIRNLIFQSCEYIL